MSLSKVACGSNKSIGTGRAQSSAIPRPRALRMPTKRPAQKGCRFKRVRCLPMAFRCHSPLAETSARPVSEEQLCQRDYTIQRASKRPHFCLGGTSNSVRIGDRNWSEPRASSGDGESPGGIESSLEALFGHKTALPKEPSLQKLIPGSRLCHRGRTTRVWSKRRFDRLPTTGRGGSGRRYSITSSAVVSSDGGIVRPSAFAVFRLMTNSNFVGCTTGRSAGFSPLRIRPA